MFPEKSSVRAWERTAKTFTMKAGSVCLMHTKVGHSSAANRGNRPRRLFIAVYSAEDAIPLSLNPLPSKHEGLIVRGEKIEAATPGRSATRKRVIFASSRL